MTKIIIGRKEKNMQDYLFTLDIVFKIGLFLFWAFVIHNFYSNIVYMNHDKANYSFCIY